MNTKTIFAAFAMFALGIACTPSEPEVEETVSQKVTATVVDNGAATAWTKSDVLGVYTDASENNVKYTAASAGTSVDYITLNVPPRAFSNVPLQIWAL